jgi:hypothetical protein
MKDIYKVEAELARIERDEAEHQRHIESITQQALVRSEVLAKAKAEAAERLAQAKEKAAQVEARLLRQIGEQTTEELVKHLMAQGVTCVGRVDARDILNDARELFESSYWTSGTEVNWVESEFSSEADARLRGQELIDDGNLEKFFVIETPQTPGQYGIFSSLCAVGGIGVIASMKAKEAGLQEHILAFGSMFERDWSTRVATAALAETIRAHKVGNPDINEYDYGRDSQDIIINYNDNLATKEDVIERFREAASHPLLEATSLWTVSNEFGGRSYQLFASKEAAQAAIDAAEKDPATSPETQVLYRWCQQQGTSPSTCEPYMVTSLEVYESQERERTRAVANADF